MVMFINKETIQRFCQVGSIVYEIDKCFGSEPQDYKIVAHTVTKIEMDFCGMAMVQCGERCFFETEFGKKYISLKNRHKMYFRRFVRCGRIEM